MKLTSNNPERQAYIDKVYAGVLDGDAHAHYLYARLFLDDVHDIDAGMMYLKRAYALEDADAAYALGYIFSSMRDRYYVGDYDWIWDWLDADDEYAYECFLFAAEHGHEVAMKELGTMLAWGVGCDRDPLLAWGWFRKSNGRHPDVECVLENEYAVDGKLTPDAFYMRKACEFRSEDARRDLSDSGVFRTSVNGVLFDIMAPQGIETLEIPESIHKLPKGILAGLRFKEFVCSPDHSDFQVIDGILYGKNAEGDAETLVRCPPGRVGEVVVPMYIKSVEDGAFAYCDKLAKITFLDDGTDPGPESAYEGCSETLEKDW